MVAVTPYISGDAEYDLFEYYVGYSDSSGVLIPHTPISIVEIYTIMTTFTNFVFLQVMKLLKFQ